MKTEKRNMKYMFKITLLIIFLIPLISLSAKKLIISEVYLDKENPKNNWIEIYNPTNKDLVLKAFSLSHIRQGNLLRGFNLGSGMNTIPAGSRLILCSSKEDFIAIWGEEGSLVQEPSLSTMCKAGFAGISTKITNDEYKHDGFLYGDPEKVKKYKFCEGTTPLSFSEDGKSFSRKIEKDKEVKKGEGFYKTEPNPFK